MSDELEKMADELAGLEIMLQVASGEIPVIEMDGLETAPDMPDMDMLRQVRRELDELKWWMTLYKLRAGENPSAEV